MCTFNATEHVPALFVDTSQDLVQDLVLRRVLGKLLKRFEVAFVHGAVLVRGERDIHADAG